MSESRIHFHQLTTAGTETLHQAKAQKEAAELPITFSDVI